MLTGLLACVTVSLVFALIPDVVSWFAYRSAAFLANADDNYYLAIARLPYFGEWSLRDPFTPLTSNDPVLYPWVLFVPFAKATAWLHLPVTTIPLVMRATGSILLALSLFLLFYRLFSSSVSRLYWTILCTLVCLTDAGFNTGRSLVANFLLLNDWRHGVLPPEGQLLGQYRIVNPLLNLPTFLALTACLLTVPRSRKYLIAAAACLAACVYQYFFFWTSAAVAISADLVIGWLAKAQSGLAWIRARSGPALLVLMLGMAAAAPEFVYRSRQLSTLRERDTVERIHPGLRLMPGDPVRTQNVRNLWVWLKIACGAAAVFVLRRREIYFPTLLVIAGYFLANSAILTGIDSENWHYTYVFSPIGEIVLLGTICFFLQRLSASTRVHRLAATATAVILLSGLSIRILEPLACAEPRDYTRGLAATAPFEGLLPRQGTSCTIAGSTLEADTLLVRSRCAMLYSYYTGENSFLSLQEIDQRHSLNGWIAGLSEQEYEKSVRQTRYLPNSYGRPQLQEPAMLSRRMALFRGMSEDYRRLMRIYRPTHVLLVAGRRPSPLLKSKLVASANGLSLFELESQQ